LAAASAAAFSALRTISATSLSVYANAVMSFSYCVVDVCIIRPFG
jgi:hypothetical protein